MLATTASIAQVLEALMLICFGMSWPVAIAKTWRSKRTEGKSRAFLMLIFLGYVSGTTAKIVRSALGQPLEWVTWLYLLNATMVAVDLVLVLHFGKKGPAMESVE